MITKEDLEKWARTKQVHRFENEEKPYGWTEVETERSAIELLEIIWPILESYQNRQNDPRRGLYADEIKLFHTLKKKLGMPIREWEK